MEKLQIFENSEFGQVRTVSQNGEVWFVGKDVATALGYAKARNAILSHVSEEDRKGAPIQGDLGGVQMMTIINESGVYALIFGSKLESAKRFKHWVTSEVLPAIRRNGGCITQDYTQIIMQTATVVCGELIKQLVPVLEGMQSRAAQREEIEPCRAAVRVDLGAQMIPIRQPCKIETFPEEIVDKVDELLEKMMLLQALNFSAVSRFCTMHGYPVSSPSVKRYYRRRYLE